MNELQRVNALQGVNELQGELQAELQAELQGVKLTALSFSGLIAVVAKAAASGMVYMCIYIYIYIYVSYISYIYIYISYISI